MNAFISPPDPSLLLVQPSLSHAAFKEMLGQQCCALFAVYCR